MGNENRQTKEKIMREKLYQLIFSLGNCYLYLNSRNPCAKYVYYVIKKSSFEILLRVFQKCQTVQFIVHFDIASNENVWKYNDSIHVFRRGIIDIIVHSKLY